jgi:glycosyltransferase involved in cell wall biosynthesis
MKIVIVAQWLNHLGGSEVLTVATALSLELLGHQVKVIVAEGAIHSRFMAQLQGRKIDLVSLNSENSMNDKLIALQKLLQQQVEIVHFIPIESLACAWMEAKTAQMIPVVVTETTNASPSVWWIGDREHNVWKKAQGVIAMSHRAAENIWHLRDNTKPLRVIPSFLPPSNGIWSPPVTAIPETALNHIGCISRLSEEKGLEFLLAAMAMLNQSKNKITLHLFGDGQERYRVESLIKAFELDNSVILHGYVNNIYKAIESCSLFILPSLTEGLPLSLIEIIASGRSFISTKVGGIPEIVNNGNWATIVEKGDSKALADAISVRVNNPQKLLRDGKQARAVYEKFWYSKLRAEAIIQLYKDVLALR